MLAAEEFDEEGAADIEGFVDDGVHAGVGVHLVAGGIAQARAEQAGGEDEQGHDGDAGESEAPFDGEHHGEDDDGLDEVGDDADDGVADGVLGADDIVVEAADHLAGFGAGEEAQGHALEFSVEGGAQVVDDAFANAGVEAAAEDAGGTLEDGHSEQGEREANEGAQVGGGDDGVDELADDEGREEREAGIGEDEEEHGEQVEAVGAGVGEDALEESPGEGGFFVCGADVGAPVGMHVS